MNDTTLTKYFGIREVIRFPDSPPYKQYEYCPELDVFMIDDAYATREEFEAKARELGRPI